MQLAESGQQVGQNVIGNDPVADGMRLMRVEIRGRDDDHRMEFGKDYDLVATVSKHPERRKLAVAGLIGGKPSQIAIISMLIVDLGTGLHHLIDSRLGHDLLAVEPSPVE